MILSSQTLRLDYDISSRKDKENKQLLQPPFIQKLTPCDIKGKKRNVKY